MKKVLLLSLYILLFSGSAIAQEDEAVYLELDKNRHTLPSSLQPDYKHNAADFKSTAQQDPLEKILFYNENDKFKTKSFSQTAEKKFGRTSFGTKYSSDVKPDSMSNSLTLFSKYQREKFSLNSSYKQSQAFMDKKTVPGVFSITPEYKLNDYFSVQNIYSSNLSNNQRKNEVVLSVHPLKNDRMNLDVGAGQVYYNDSRPGSSQFNFSTRFKF